MKFINSVKYISFFVLAVSLILTTSSFQTTPQSDNTPPKKTFTVVLDPGHGGAALGAVGRRSKEKDIVLEVSKKLKKELEVKLGINVLLTRSSDVDVPFRTRSGLANKNRADIFISIHANSAKSSSDRYRNISIRFS